MSRPGERGTLFRHAARLHEAHPGGPLPHGGHPLPSPAPTGDLPLGARRAALTAAVEAHFADPARSPRDLHDALAGSADAPLRTLPAPADADRARMTGRWLLLHATTPPAARIGLALLATAGRPADARLIRTVGLLRCLSRAAVDALAGSRAATPDLVWLADRSAAPARMAAVQELCRRAGPDAVDWLLRHAADGPLPASLAREVAEAVSLTGVLESGRHWAHGVRLLLALTAPGGYRVRLPAWPAAVPAFRAAFRHAVAGHPLLAALTEELRSGYAAGLDWEPGERRRLLGGLDDGFRVRIVVPGPVPGGDVAVRILAGGRPVIAAAFGEGPPGTPEDLLGRGRLRAGAEPHEVRLATADCTEGCCGALYVTIVREGGTVVWRDWRGHTSPEPPPVLRFPAVQYDAELARAEADRSWEWPARTVARLVRDRLRDEPGRLGRWQCRPGWVAARPHEPDHIELTFHHPPAGESLQFALRARIGPAPAAEQAEAIVRDLTESDPRTPDRLVGGSAELAGQLGYRWPPGC